MLLAMGTVEVRGTMFPLHMVYHPLIGPILFATNMTHIFCRKEKQICYTLFWAMKIVCQVVMVHDIEGHMDVHIPVTDPRPPPKKTTPKQIIAKFNGCIWRLSYI
jgi:hypothetical protein